MEAVHGFTLSLDSLPGEEAEELKVWCESINLLLTGHGFLIFNADVADLADFADVFQEKSAPSA